MIIVFRHLLLIVFQHAKVLSFLRNCNYKISLIHILLKMLVLFMFETDTNVSSLSKMKIYFPENIFIQPLENLQSLLRRFIGR